MSSEIIRDIYIAVLYDTDVGNIINTDAYSSLENCDDFIRSVLYSFEPFEGDPPDVFDEYKKFNWQKIADEAYKDLDKKGYWSYWLPGKHRLIYVTRKILKLDVNVSVDMETT